MKVLISGCTGLGNFILRIPMINKIKELFPNAKVDVITGTSSLLDPSPVAKKMKSVNNVYRLSWTASISEKVRFFHSLKKVKYDAFFLPFDSRPRFLILGSYLAHIPLRVLHENFTKKGFTNVAKLSLRLQMYPKTLHVPLLQGRHEIDLNYDLLEAYLNTPFERDYSTPIPFEETPSLLQRFNLMEKKYFVLQLSARYGYPTPKVWNPQHFRKLIEHLHNNYPNYALVTVGSESEYESYIKEFVESFPYLINTAGKVSLNDAISIIAKSKLVIAHDSGLTHIANAVNAPLIALYGPTDYTRTRPLGANSHLLFSKNQYFANMYNFNTTEEHLSKEAPPYACMDGITVENVLEIIKKIIS